MRSISEGIDYRETNKVQVDVCVSKHTDGQGNGQIKM